MPKGESTNATSRRGPAGYATVAILRRNPLAADAARPLPLADAARLSLWQPIQVAVEEGRRKVAPADGLRLRLVVVDELASYLTMGERRDTAAFAAALRDLVSRGRAARIIVVAATQKPSHEIMLTRLRDVFAFRWALRCTTPQASDTILGAGWTSLGASAADVDAAARGVGWLLHEGATPVRLRSYLLDEADLAQVAARAAWLRASAAASPPLRAVEG